MRRYHLPTRTRTLSQLCGEKMGKLSEINVFEVSGQLEVLGGG